MHGFGRPRVALALALAEITFAFGEPGATATACDSHPMVCAAEESGAQRDDPATVLFWYLFDREIPIARAAIYESQADAQFFPGAWFAYREAERAGTLAYRVGIAATDAGSWVFLRQDETGAWYVIGEGRRAFHDPDHSIPWPDEARSEGTGGVSG